MIVVSYAEENTVTSAEAALIEKIATSAETEVRSHLPNLGDTTRMDVYINDYVIPELGCTGASIAPGLISWTVTDNRPIATTAIKHLRETMFHELHHQVRGWTMTKNGTPSMIEAAVNEGLATAFERDAANSNPPWGTYPDGVSSWVEELLSLGPNADYTQWMFDHNDGRRWIGYRAGTYLADQAITATGQTAAQLVNTPTNLILEAAGYSPPQLPPLP